jgi:hypothetical protein
VIRISSRSPYTEVARIALDKGKQIRVDHIGVSGEHAVRVAGIDRSVAFLTSLVGGGTPPQGLSPAIDGRVGVEFALGNVIR